MNEVTHGEKLLHSLRWFHANPDEIGGIKLLLPELIERLSVLERETEEQKAQLKISRMEITQLQYLIARTREILANVS